MSPEPSVALIFARAQALWPDFDEMRFVDGATRSLANSDFHLLIVGDGIRTDLMTIVEHMTGTGAGLAAGRDPVV